MKTVVLSLGGSVLVPSLEENKIAEWSAVLRELSGTCRLFVVVGGGGEARRYIRAGRDLGIDEGTSDEVGILVTRLNAALLSAALGPAAYPEIPTTHNKALAASRDGSIVIMGGVTPAQTTDAVSAVLAERSGADLLINATSIDGIYSADPKKNPGASRYAHLTPEELCAIVEKERIEAGSNTVIDLVAAKVIQRSGIPLLVIDGRRPENITDAYQKGIVSGTLVSRDDRAVLPL